MIVLDISVDEVALDTVDPSDFVYAYRGRVVDQDDETERGRTLGRFTLQYVDMGATMDAGQDIFEMFDATSQTLTEVYEGRPGGPQTIDGEIRGRRQPRGA